ncbi:kinase-like domain-containing protein [Mycena latifolia]|nr:kinase-like domain-containing protein [Mycena latifolia]
MLMHFDRSVIRISTEGVKLQNNPQLQTPDTDLNGWDHRSRYILWDGASSSGASFGFLIQAGNLTQLSAGSNNGMTMKPTTLSTDSTEILGAAEEIVVKTFSTMGRFQISIDVRGSQSVPVALIRKLASISPHCKSELVLSSWMHGFTVLEKNARMVENAPSLIVRPLKHILRKHGLTTLIIRGVGTEQAPDVYDILLALKESHDLNIVVMGEPGVRPERQRFTFDDMQTLYVSDDGLIMYSGRNPSEPALYKNLFRILLEGVWQRPDAASLRIWEGMWERTNLPLDFDPQSATTAGICSALHHAWDYSRWMLKALSTLESATYPDTQGALQRDNIDVCDALRLLFSIGSYKHDIRLVPRDHAINLLNLMYSIVDSRSPNNSGIWLDRGFLGHAQHLLQLLANLLGVLPEALHVPDVILLTESPVKSGGFADIFHGQYNNQAAEKVEVALKVLRIFSSQSDTERRILQENSQKRRFHDNIVPFIGVNSTFPGQTMAMVSLWMAQGSVLTYMADRSLLSRSAISLRNILINQDGRACLADFGLAAFIEVQTSIKTSMRSGSGKWMAPELLLPEVYRPDHPFQRTVESDVWAFACVACEIWTEGTIPFVDRSEGAIIMEWSNPDTEQGTRQLIPYTWPQNKRGQAMPQRLWELVQSCWKRNPILRPTVWAVYCLKNKNCGGEKIML